jgi:hypothetical protein
MASVRASVVLFFMPQKQSEKLGREDDLTNSKLILAIDSERPRRALQLSLTGNVRLIATVHWLGNCYTPYCLGSPLTNREGYS